MNHLVYKALMFFSLISFPNISIAQETSGSDKCKCNYSCWPAVEKPENLTSQDILGFLKSLSRECESNVEFSETSNEVLFKILEENSELFIGVLEKQKSTEIEYIIHLLESPENDSIDISKIVMNVKNTPGGSLTKKRIIHALEKALNKYTSN